jgi:hypothetical protein
LGNELGKIPVLTSRDSRDLLLPQDINHLKFVRLYSMWAGERACWGGRRDGHRVVNESRQEPALSPAFSGEGIFLSFSKF